VTHVAEVAVNNAVRKSALFPGVAEAMGRLNSIVPQKITPIKLNIIIFVGSKARNLFFFMLN
jgi:hypothetical protein